jgi:hypothetical protein
MRILTVEKSVGAKIRMTSQTEAWFLELPPSGNRCSSKASKIRQLFIC